MVGERGRSPDNMARFKQYTFQLRIFSWGVQCFVHVSNAICFCFRTFFFNICTHCNSPRFSSSDRRWSRVLCQYRDRRGMFSLYLMFAIIDSGLSTMAYCVQTTWEKPEELMTPEEINATGDWVSRRTLVFFPCLFSLNTLNLYFL